MTVFVKKTTMQILNLPTDIDAPLYCPFSGIKLYDEGFEDHGDSPFVQCIWISEALDMPSMLKGEMKEKWKSYDEEQEFEEWLEELDVDNHFAICVFHPDLIGLTTWYVFRIALD